MYEQLLRVVVAKADAMRVSVDTKRARSVTISAAQEH